MLAQRARAASAVVTASSGGREPRRAARAQPEVIASGKVAIMNARPTSAGLNRLKPSPPKIVLPIRIANAPPSSAVHHGTLRRQREREQQAGAHGAAVGERARGASARGCRATRPPRRRRSSRAITRERAPAEHEHAPQRRRAPARRSPTT